MDDVIVVGSGPTAVAFARAALRRGAVVRMVDVGRQLDGGRLQAVSRLKRQSPREWSRDDLELTSEAYAPGQGLSRKRRFGSAFAYESEGICNVEVRNSCGAVPSFARGGLSTVWGAAAPAIHSAANRHEVPFADALVDAETEVDEYFPSAEVGGGSPSSLPSHGFIDDVFGRYERREDSLRRHRIRMERARLAIRTSGPDACCGCRRCLVGCVYGAIWSSEDELSWLRRQARFSYTPDLRVDSLEEVGSGVQVLAVNVASRQRFRLAASTVVLAAGAIGSLSILDRSKLLESTATIRDYQTFFLPMFWMGSNKGIVHSRGIDLSQLWLSISNEREETIGFIQLYAYNESLPQRVGTMLPQRLGGMGKILSRPLRNMVVGIGYVDSDRSGRIAVRGASDGGISVDAVESPATRTAVRSLSQLVTKALAPIGVFPIAAGLQMARIGEGYHLSTAEYPELGQRQVLDDVGRPSGIKRIHVVDGAALRPVPPGPITKLMMCNSVRIAQEMFS